MKKYMNMFLQAGISNNIGQKIYLRNINGEYDWVYEDEDITFELILEIGASDCTDDVKLNEAVWNFVDYCQDKFGLNDNESFMLFSIIIHQDVEQYIKEGNLVVSEDTYKFLTKYNFKIFPCETVGKRNRRKNSKR